MDGYLRIYDVAAFEAATRALLTRLFGLPAAPAWPDCPEIAPARRSQLGARAVAHRSRGLPILRAGLPCGSEGLCRRYGAPSKAIAQPLALQASGADGAPCVRYAGGTAPLAALQELAESLARGSRSRQWTVDMTNPSIRYL